MAKEKNTLFPRTVNEAVANLNTDCTYLEVSGTRLGIPPNETAALRTQVDDLNVKHTKAGNKDLRSKLDVAERDMAVETTQMTTRKIIDFYVIGNPNATPVDYEALNIPSKPHHLLPSPEHAPGIGHIVSEDLNVHIPFFDAQTGKLGKPEGVYAIESYLKLGVEPPKDISEMTERKVATASPIHIPFDVENEFETLHIVFGWVGTRGDYGPWSEMHKVIIVG
jgi:hypothetical protein